MTPPAATVAARTAPARRSKPAEPAKHRGGRTRRPAAPAGRHATTMPRGARRVSGPSAGLGAVRMNGTPAGALAGGGVLTAPLGVRLARRAACVPDARFLDRLIRGRVWIVLIGAMLIGLVFLQLTLLSLNAGIGEALQKSSVLERQNSALRTQVSKMDAGQRVQAAAARQGLIMPTAGARKYLEAGAVSPAVAARGISVPKEPTTTPAAAPVTTAPAPVTTAPAPVTPPTPTATTAAVPAAPQG